MSSILFPIARGVSLGTGITDIKRIEDSVRAGRNAIFTFVMQTAEVHYASMLTGEALLSAELPAVPALGRTILYITPAVLAFFIKRGIDSPRVRNCALFVQNNIGLVCQIAAAVSSIALIAFGNLALGIGALTFVALGFLDRSGLLPTCIRFPLHEYSPVIQIATSLVIGDVVEKVFATISIASFALEKYIKYADSQPTAIDLRSAQKQTLNIDLLDRILDDKVKLEINPYHLKLDTLAPPPNVSILGLRTLFDAIDWDIHLPTLKLKMAEDDRFKELHGTIEDKWLAPLARESLENYLQSVINRHIPNGEIHDYELLENYLKTITAQLPYEDELTQADALMRLAIEAGGYCGPKKLHVPEELYSELALKNSEISPEIKILLRLQNARTAWFQAKYIEMSRKGGGSSLFDFQDLHVYNIFLNVYGQELGLHKSSSDNDYASTVDAVTKFLLKGYTEQIKTSFKEMYTSDYAMNQLQNGVGYASLPRSTIYQWWANWIDRQPLSVNRKEDLHEELQNENSLLYTPMQEGNLLTPGAFNQRFLKAMALDIGILRLDPSGFPRN